jgi:hypothetical protein
MPMTYLFALALAQAAVPAPAAPAKPAVLPSRTAIETMNPSEVARLLIADRAVAARMKGVTHVRWPGRDVSIVYLSEPAIAYGSDLCAETNHIFRLVPATPAPDAAAPAADGPVRAEPHSSRKYFGIRGSRSCGDQKAMIIYSSKVSEAETAALLRRLIRARDLAAGTAPLPYKLSCADADAGAGEGRCAGGGRTALATLPIHDVSALEPVAGGWQFRLTLAPGGKEWTIRLSAEGESEAVAITRGVVPQR